MADYNLNGLNPRDFQHLVQALARKQVAAGVTAFGDGKDGNRDLTYRGKMNYPTTEEVWEGYLVLGCKFNQRPTGDTGKDANWAIKQLTDDLNTFLDPERDLPKPEYYIFATNIALTGVAGSGGRDRVTQVLKEYTPKLNLKGSEAWDYNDLRGFLDGDKDIRSAYGHFITAGDVLAQIVETLKLQRPDFAEVMHTFLQKELLADMSAKLQSAGEDPEVQIPLANVFVDLPVTESVEAATLSQSSPDTEQSNVIERLLDAGTYILRRQQPEASIRSEDDPGTLSPRSSRFVLVGGPGQGKSTLSQYLCQLYRAAILKDRPLDRLDERVPRIIQELEQQQKDSGCLPITRRFPIRIELRAFSSALAIDSNLTLIEYLRTEISRLGSTSIHLEDLKSWLGSYPWLLVLDGLDEVPPSSNRQDVMQQIENFQVDAVSLGADILIVTTTRPQSYSKEFPSERFRHLYLRPLSPEQALAYGQRLAHARCGADERRREELLNNLEKACQAETTARLMQSPLQVTIMATLLEETGEPPQQRYRLFAEYYRAIYKRETRRKMLEGILSERQTDIDTIHTEAGLLLHAFGEQAVKSGSNEERRESESSFSDDQFRKLTHRRLTRIKVPEPKASELVKRITDGSLQRLVFLVRPREGRIQFDIASLKEFMAAEALMTGPDECIRERLKAVAPTAYWRNALLFAVGKCFIEKEYLLDNVVSMCEGLNDDKVAEKLFNDETAGACAKRMLWGSRLALDILVEGTAKQNPEYESRLARVALELVRVPDPETAAQLAAIYYSDLIEVFQEVIEDRLGQSEFQRQRGAWLLLMSLSDRDIDWARGILEHHWPREPERQQTLLLLRGNSPWRSWSMTKLVDILPHCDPFGPPSSSLLRALSRGDFSRIQLEYYPDWWQPATALLMDFYRGHSFEKKNARIDITNRTSFSIYSSFTLRSARKDHPNPLRNLQLLPSHSPGWAPFISAARFLENPTQNALYEELKWLGENGEPRQWYWLEYIPWPLAACIQAAQTEDDLKLLADRARSGRLGTPEIWAAAESRWIEKGVTDDDVHAISDDRWPFDEHIAESGFPFAACYWSRTTEYWSRTTEAPNSKYEELIRQFHQTPPSHLKSWNANNIISLLAPYPSRKGQLPFSLVDLQKLFTALPAGQKSFDLNCLSRVQVPSLLSPEWITFFDWLGRNKFGFYMNASSCPWTEQFFHSFSSAPEERRGLLPLLVALVVSGNKCRVPRETLQLCRGWDKYAREHTVLLNLSYEDCTPEEVVQLAKEVAGSSYLLSMTLAMLRRDGFPLERSAAFALALFRELQASKLEAYEAFDQIVSVLTEYLNKRPSLLEDPDVWKNLDLPEHI